METVWPHHFKKAARASYQLSTQIIADRVLRAIKEDRFYVLSDADAWRRSCESRLEDIRLVRNPTFMPPV